MRSNGPIRAVFSHNAVLATYCVRYNGITACGARNSLSSGPGMRSAAVRRSAWSSWAAAKGRSNAAGRSAGSMAGGVSITSHRRYFSAGGFSRRFSGPRYLAGGSRGMTSRRGSGRSPAKGGSCGWAGRAVCRCGAGGRGRARRRFRGDCTVLTRGATFTSLGLSERRGRGMATYAASVITIRSCSAGVIFRPRGRRRVQTL